MSLLKVFSYYGRLDVVNPSRLLLDDIIVERRRVVLEELKETEDRIKRHITECKREVIKEMKNLFNEFKPKKEKVNEPRSKKNVD